MFGDGLRSVMNAARASEAASVGAAARALGCSLLESSSARSSSFLESSSLFLLLDDGGSQFERRTLISEGAQPFKRRTGAVAGRVLHLQEQSVAAVVG